MVIKMDHRVFRFATRGHCIKGKQCYHIAIWSPKLISVLNLFSSNLWSCLLREDVAAICQFIFGYFGEMRRMRVTSPTYKIEKKHSAHLSLLIVDQNSKQVLLLKWFRSSLKDPLRLNDWRGHKPTCEDMWFVRLQLGRHLKRCFTLNSRRLINLKFFLKSFYAVQDVLLYASFKLYTRPGLVLGLWTDLNQK